MITASNTSERRMFWLVAALFSVIGFVIYSKVIFQGIFLFDDFEYVVGNSLIQGFSSFNLSDSRQVGYLSFMVNYALGGENPLGYHFVNTIIHILNAVLVFILVRLLLGLLMREEQPGASFPSGIAFLTGLIFLVHPLQTQSVSYVTQRFTSLATLFYLLSVVSYLRSRSLFEETGESRRAYLFYGVSLLCALLAMRTKEIAFTIPLMLGLLEVAVFSRSLFNRRRFIYLIPHLALLAIIPISLLGPELGLIAPGSGIAEVTRQEKLFDLFQRSFHEYFFTQFRVIIIYIRLLLFPAGQRVVYNMQVSRSLAEPAVLLSLTLILLILGSALHLWKRSSQVDPAKAIEDRLIVFGIAWFFLTLSVESSVIPIKDLIFEHRVYLPSIGFFLAASVLLVRLARRFKKNASPVFTISALACVVAVPLSLATYTRNGIWTDEVKFWDDVVKKNPDKAIGYHNRGNAYAKIGQYELALRDIDKTISFFPTNPNASQTYESADFTPSNMSKTYLNRGQIYEFLGEPKLAASDYDKARALMAAGSLDVNNSLKLANLYAKRGAYKHAIEELDKILVWDPKNIDALNDRANAYSWTSNYAGAIRDFNRIIDIAPDNALAHHNRGISYAWSGDRKKAVTDFRQACELGFQPACESIEKVRRGEK